MTATTRAARYANEAAPHPEPIYDNLDCYPDSVVADLARHHIARAYGFSAAAFDTDNPRQVDATNRFLQELRLALVWQHLAAVTIPDAKGIAVDVIEAVHSPQVMESTVAELMAWARLDPETIRPFMQAGRGEQVTSQQTADGVTVRTMRVDGAVHVTIRTSDHAVITLNGQTIAATTGTPARRRWWDRLTRSGATHTVHVRAVDLRAGMVARLPAFHADGPQRVWAPVTGITHHLPPLDQVFVERRTPDGLTHTYRCAPGLVWEVRSDTIPRKA